MSHIHVASPCRFQCSVPLVKLTQYCGIRKIPSIRRNLPPKLHTLQAGGPLHHSNTKAIRPWWGARGAGSLQTHFTRWFIFDASLDVLMCGPNVS